MSIREGKERIKEVLDFLEENLSCNYPSACVFLGSVVMALHYQVLTRTVGNVPIPFAIGDPCTGKSTVAEIFMMCIGVKDSIHGISFEENYI